MKKILILVMALVLSGCELSGKSAQSNLDGSKDGLAHRCIIDSIPTAGDTFDTQNGTIFVRRMESQYARLHWALYADGTVSYYFFDHGGQERAIIDYDKCMISVPGKFDFIIGYSAAFEFNGSVSMKWTLYDSSGEVITQSGYEDYDVKPIEYCTIEYCF